MDETQMEYHPEVGGIDFSWSGEIEKWLNLSQEALYQKHYGDCYDKVAMASLTLARKITNEEELDSFNEDQEELKKLVDTFSQYEGGLAGQYHGALPYPLPKDYMVKVSEVSKKLKAFIIKVGQKADKINNSMPK